MFKGLKGRFREERRGEGRVRGREGRREIDTEIQMVGSEIGNV